MTPSQAKHEISRRSWDELGLLVKSSLHSGGPRYRQTMHKHLCDTRLFTLEQARTYLDVYKPSSASAPASRSSGGRRRDESPVCRKCVDGGLSGKYVRHKTKDCRGSIRRMNIEKFKDPNRRKRGRERSVNFSGFKRPKNGDFKKSSTSKSEEDECKTCKAAGRNCRHSSKSCKFAPGGAWHNKSGEELRRLQKKFFEEKKRARSGRSQTNSASQKTPLRKRTRAEQESLKNHQIPVHLSGRSIFP